MRQSQKNHPYNCRPSRSSQGQALVEGVVALALIIAGTVGAALLLTNVGLSIYFKNKLSYASNQAAQFAFTIRDNPNVQSETTQFVTQFLPQLGIAPSQLEVTVNSSAIIAGRPAATVSIKNTFNLLGSGSIIPANVVLSDSGSAISPTTAVAAAGPEGRPGPPGPPGGLNTVGMLQVPTDFGPPLMLPIAGVRPTTQENRENLQRNKMIFSLSSGSRGATSPLARSREDLDSWGALMPVSGDIEFSRETFSQRTSDGSTISLPQVAP